MAIAAIITNTIIALWKRTSPPSNIAMAFNAKTTAQVRYAKRNFRDRSVIFSGQMGIDLKIIFLLVDQGTRTVPFPRTSHLYDVSSRRAIGPRA